MATTLMPIDPQLSPQRVTRVLTISADLMPEELVASRRANRTRGWVLAVLVLVLIGVGGWYAKAEHELSGANDDLAAITEDTTALQRQQTRYAEVVGVQAETKAVVKQLSTLLANDLPWSALIGTLRDTGSDAGVTIDGMSATLNSTTNPEAAAALPSASAAATIGSVTITGTAPDKPSVAKYVDSLGVLTTVANPYLTSVTDSESGDGEDAVQFSLTVDITSKALCGRFTTKCTTGGK